ncbi:MAG: DUF1729 domain-containing protein [Micrococcaceae bacterium]
MSHSSRLTSLFHQTLGADSDNPFAITFAGQSSPWLAEITELLKDDSIAAVLTDLVEKTDELLAPVHKELTLIGNGKFTLTPQADAESSPFYSVPGILATQLASLEVLAEDGFDLRHNAPSSVQGHSQGILAAEFFSAWAGHDTKKQAEIFATSRLIGAATSSQVVNDALYAIGAATPMLSVQEVSHKALTELLDSASLESVNVSLVNSPTRFVLSGNPAHLQQLIAAGKEREATEAQAIEKKTHGGKGFKARYDFLHLGAPYHSQLLKQAYQQVLAWAKATGIDHKIVEPLAKKILLEPVDWPIQLGEIIESGAHWVLDLGPGESLDQINAENLNGTGIGTIALGTAASRDKFMTLGNTPAKTIDWAKFAPTTIELPNGKTVVDTKFSRLTGRSPVLLPGMTPTTVDAKIVAAAANAGYWAELAGGGQVTEEVYTQNLKSLRKQLKPGHTAQFNAMFLDRYLWNLQFGTQSIVLKSRAAGAPLDGVTISAGIPELDEADALIEELKTAGMPYIAFKPGTVAQIRQVLAIAREVEGTDIIMHVEDGHAGGHHSWENLDDLLLSTYTQIREHENVVLCVGGGIGTPERAADYISGEWSLPYNNRKMPVDGVLIGTAAMTAKEAKTTEEVKQLLLKTKGVPPAVEDTQGGWIGEGQTRNGMASSLSHLRADIHEIDNSASACARLIAEVTGDAKAIAARKDEIVEALNKTAKPYFGDLDTMTYLEWATRFAKLSYPWVDETWIDRFLDLLHRIEGRLNEAEYGEIETLFPDIDSVREPFAAIDKLVEKYPTAKTLLVTPRDAAWFTELIRKHPKPMPFVPVLDDDILRWWGQDNLWQSQDDRYSADQVRIIPGPVSVAGIDRINEPIGELLARFEAACAARITGETTKAYARLARAKDAAEFITQAPHIMWNGNLIENPAHILQPDTFTITEQEDNTDVYDVTINFDTYWDEDPKGADHHAVRSLTIPLRAGKEAVLGAMPVVDRDTLPENMYALLAATAGVGGSTITGDPIDKLPVMKPSKDSEFGEATWAFTVNPSLAALHRTATAAALPAEYQPVEWVPDALLGMCWPAIYAALGSAMVDDYPVIEGLLSAVHLDHTARLDVNLAELLADGPVELTVVARTVELLESSAGRIVVVKETLLHDGEEIGEFSERFAIRGRIGATTPPPAVADAGGNAHDMIDTPRSTLRHVRVTAPADMTPFANVSGDFNPIHTSTNASIVAGLRVPLVHGMWLSAVAQNLVSASGSDGVGNQITGWSYNMYGLVNLNDEIDLTAERIGRLPDGGQVIEVTSKINGQVVSRGTAATLPVRTAYVYPGQGIQAQGMGLDEMESSAAAKEVWEKADQVTKDKLGFSIINVVRDNPTEIVSEEQTWRHPEGLLNLTQFTQVAMATMAFAQTERLREQNALVSGAYFAGHSLGEYTALSSYGEVIPLETVLEIVFHRGSTMHNLVERDEQGRSNYRMGALRPNQFGISDAQVIDYIESVAEKSGEFLQIVNFNLAGQQYAIAGTIAGLKALEADVEERTTAFGGRNAFMYIPGLDVPFHSKVLRDGVEEFREKLLKLLPEKIDYKHLAHSYIPNLVAIPFELTRSFAETIVEEVDSQTLRELLEKPEAWEKAAKKPEKLARLLLVELLCWQFASPVRWIETQELLLTPREAGGLGVERLIEIGLAASPTLTSLGEKTLKLPEFSGTRCAVLNVQRDEKVVTHNDVRSIEVEPEEETPTETKAESETPVEEAPTVAPAEPVTEVVETAPAPAAPVASGERPADIPFTASAAIKTLMAYTNKLRLDQITNDDTTDTLTNGASARRNQLLMDLSAELGLASIDGAADANVAELSVSVDRLAHNYQAFGPVLGEAIRDRIRKLFGSAGVKATRISERVKDTWLLGEGWVHAVTAEILLGSRDGDSSRGGSLSTLPLLVSSAAEADDLIDQAVQAVATAHGVSVSLPQATGSSTGGAVVDSAALDQFKEDLLGSNGLLADSAKSMLEALGLAGVSKLEEGTPEADEEAELAQKVADAVSAELGSTWLDQVSPVFDEKKAVLLDDRWASAREDLARLWNDPKLKISFKGTGEAIAEQAKWWSEKAKKAGNASLSKKYTTIAQEATDQKPGKFAEDVALVTGAAPTSIAGAVTAKLLSGGATVIMTASRIDAKRLDFAKQLYRENASAGAKLWVVPANLSSYRDVDALIDWVGHEQVKVVGPVTTVLKPALTPTLFLPFAAPSVMGTLADAGENFEAQSRLLLWSVERAIAGLAQQNSSTTKVNKKVHVILPGSPNRGIFGGDGAYGETKSAFDALLNRWSVEKAWAKSVTLAHPKIGWVRGTGLMGGNDPLVNAAEKAGIQTYSTTEIADELIKLCSNTTRKQALTKPVLADLTGGLDDGVDLVALKESAMADLVTEEETVSEESTDEIPALSAPANPDLIPYEAKLWKDVTARAEDMVVIVGIGEVSTWGSARTRHQAELGIHTDGTVDLTPAGVLELAWMMGLLRWKDSPNAGWYNAEDELIPENEIFTRYRDEVIARSGVRSFVNEGAIEDRGSEEDATVFLSHDVTFTVPDKETAESYVVEDPRLTRIQATEDGEWEVTRLAGARAQLPRRATLTRTVGGQLPTDFDASKWGIPQSVMEGMDRMTAWNLVTTVDAFLSAGFTPAELLQAIHPTEVASTQGTGFGGMTSMRKLFVDRFLGEDYPSDILQETLPNVMAAHVMQTYVGGYGSMIHPVGACATAAVSIEEGVDKITCGKASFVVAGAIDDMAVESIVGFGSMNATANSQNMADKGINERFYSRANDRRRDGFIEAQGGGTVLLARGDVAAQMGLPVLAVVGFAQSFADGIHTSIPAPGIGALGAARGGKKSLLSKSIAKLGVTADDIAVISKHDTSTNANDPNESDLHTRLAKALDRTPGNPMFVISQKTLTGHAKGGAAVFQVSGICQLFADHHIPGNISLDCVDDALAEEPWLVWLRQPLDVSSMGTFKAAMLTSLGFGHVSSLVVLVHPGAFEAALRHSEGNHVADQWRKQAETRIRQGARRLEAGMIGHAELFEQAPNRRFSSDVDAHEAEAAMLLDPHARLNTDGIY